MKITQSQSDFKIQKQEMNHYDKGVSSGKIIQGKVVAIDGNRITIEVDGFKQSLTNISENQFHLNQHAKLVVVAFEDGTIYVKPASDAIDQILDYSPVGLEAQTLKARIALLQNLNIPVTEENDLRLKQMNAEIKVLQNEIVGQPEKAEFMIGKTFSNNESLRQMIVMMSQNIQSETNNMQNLVNLTHYNELTDVIQHDSRRLSDLLLLFKDAGNEILRNEILAFKNTGITKEQLLSIIENSNGIENSDVIDVLKKQLSGLSDKAIILSSIIDGSNESGTFIKAQYLRAINAVFSAKGTLSITSEMADIKSETPLVLSAKLLLSQFNTQVTGMFLKNNLPVTLKNILTTHLLLNQNQTIGESFIKLSDMIQTLSTENHLAILSLIDDNKPEDALEKLLVMIKQLDIVDETKNNINQEIIFIKEASHVVKQFSDQVMVMHFPIQLEQETKNVRLYYKARGKQRDDNAFMMLVALKTEHLDEVRCIVEKKSNQINLHFKLIDEAVCSAFKEAQTLLTEALDGLSFGQFNLTFAVYESMLEGLLIEDSVHSQTVDIKV